MSEPGVGKVFHSKMVSKVSKVSSKRVLMEQEPKFLVLVLMTDCFLFLSFFSPPLPPSPPSFPLPLPTYLPTFLPSFLPVSRGYYIPFLILQFPRIGTICS